MTRPNRPYYVSFTHDRIPTTVDQSQRNPGPTATGANRAGFTRVRSRARMTIPWDVVPTDTPNVVALYAMSVNVIFRLTDFMVAISSDYEPGSCAYRVTRHHEFEAHIYDPIRIFHSYRDILIGRLNRVAVPHSGSPLRVESTRVEATQDRIGGQVASVIRTTKAELRDALFAARDAHDTPESYRLVYEQCAPSDW